MKKITQKEIAAKLGLHVRTISRALNYEGLVKEKTRMRIVEELNRNGYFFNTHTRPEVVVVDVRQGYLETKALRLLDMLSNRDLQFKMANHTKDLQQFYNVAGKSNIVVFCSTPSAKIIAETGKRCPGVYRINLFSHGVPGAEVSIGPDNDTLGKRSARYLAEKGHRDILIISSHENAAALERTKSFIGELAVAYPHVKYRILYLPLNLQIRSQIYDVLQTQPLPSALYCPGLYLAWQTCQALNQLNYHIPEQISLLINDLPEDFEYQLPFSPDTIFSRTSDIIQLADFYITNRFMLKSARSIIAAPGTELQVNGTVANLSPATTFEI